MGNARWDAQDYSRYQARSAGQTREQIFSRSSVHPDQDPVKIKFRESVDSPMNPNSTPIILAADDTGSMGILAETIIRKGLGTIFGSIYTHKPVPDPHICCMAVGDANTDRSPLQVTQFEASVDPLTKQVADLYIEEGGGGNGGESYPLVWWFATYKVSTDASKKGRKGYLFTIGDESPHLTIRKDQITKIFGKGAEADMDVRDLLRHTQHDWHVYHLIVKPVTDQNVIANWKSLLGERAIFVKNEDKLAEVITTLIAINESADHQAVVAEFDPDTQNVVKSATQHLLPAGA